MTDVRQKLVGLLDYVEQVIRLDEKVAYELSEYRLPDGSTFAVTNSDTHNLPSVRHDTRDEEGPVWLEIDRLSRREPPVPPAELADWIALSADPNRVPDVRPERIVTVSARERDAALSIGQVRPDDVLEAPRKRRGENEVALFDLKLRLEDRPELAASIERWITEIWSPWAVVEQPRRRTIALYQVLYKIFQLLEVGGAESSIELIWGIGIVQWQKEGRAINRPLLERRAEIELDDSRGGMIRIRPTSADAAFDLKPYEEVGVANLAGLSDMMRREIQRAGENEGISPFSRDSFEPILSAAGARLDPEGVYSPEVGVKPPSATASSPSRLVVSDKWVIFARPRSQHVILHDIDRIRKSAEDSERPLEGLAKRLVTPPSSDVGSDGWRPLGARIGETSAAGTEGLEERESSDVFFPKPFNDDQLEIVRRLSKSDGLVVQGPPGTGKTHTIANLICHAMATGQRVLVVSRGEAALAVLKQQLPKEVQQLAISVLSNEREGLRQVESAIREVQGVVEGTQPESRRAAIVRLEQELKGLQIRVATIDRELDEIASNHLAKIGPKNESPAELAQRLVRERAVHEWFVDRPVRFSSEIDLNDRDIFSLYEARTRSGSLLDHIDVSFPSSADLPSGNDIAACHGDLVAAARHSTEAGRGPALGLRVTAGNAAQTVELAQSLDALVRVREVCATSAIWLESFRQSALTERAHPWIAHLRERIAESQRLTEERATLLRRPVEIPHGLLDDQGAIEAVERAADGQRLWPLVSFGRGAAKAHVGSIRLDGVFPKEDDQRAWRHVADVIANMLRQREARGRWEAFAQEIGAPTGSGFKTAIDLSAHVLRVCDDARKKRGILGALAGDSFVIEDLAEQPEICLGLATQLRAAASSANLAGASKLRERTLAYFDQSEDRTSVLAKQLLSEALGNVSIDSERIAAAWNGVLRRLDQLKSLANDFETIKQTTSRLAEAGAPSWANRLRVEIAGPDEVIARSSWRDSWDYAASESLLDRIDARHRLIDLMREREEDDKRCRKLFGEIVRERTFYALERRLSPAIKAALVEFVRALARIGRGTGKAAWTHRRTARDAMARCYSAVPCWIMPTWRVAEQLPADIGVLDLVIIDEASQSDITELPALLRGKKILVVGDDRQVSPTAPFVTQEKIGQLRHHYLGDMPFKSLLEPGESIYDLMRAVFPDQRLMLKEHFRCVEPIIQFSMQFYPERMLPLRIPSASERLDPPLVDIFVPHGSRGRSKKINSAEAEVIVEDIARLTGLPEMRERTIGVISLVGKEQAEHIRTKLSEAVGEEIMQRHAILCGDSATFQGSERDVVYLSMVADSSHKTALTMLRYEQRFNVAVSRARDRVVLVRSVRREELNPNDLKARLIAHFERPMPDREKVSDALSTCESNFERDLMQRLLERGYRVHGQVGSIGYRIDMVVEGATGARLAVECDGDRYHGPEHWQQDMRRQRTLERVGWRFWRCFASSFYRDPDAILGDLCGLLSRMGIEPILNDARGDLVHRYTEHRVIQMPSQDFVASLVEQAEGAEIDTSSSAPIGGKIRIGDKVVLVFADDQKRLSVRLVEGANDLDKGRLSVGTPLGQAVLMAEEGDEVDLVLEHGKLRKVLIEGVESTHTVVSAETRRDEVAI
ncbi:AAA domain-containing protein [Bradyrhizobium genosp. A]|uniref:AAA domain-containing protein n=1 Tax=Bradyrhizobium genosp. A TaxID=83626 RepID=UPI003CF83152